MLTDAGVCRWTYEEPDYCPSCDVAGYTLLITFTLTADLSNRCVATLQLQLVGPEDSECIGDVITWQRIYASPAAFDCSGANALPYVSLLTDGPACGGYPSGSVTVAPG